MEVLLNRCRRRLSFDRRNIRWRKSLGPGLRRGDEALQRPSTSSRHRSTPSKRSSIHSTKICREASSVLRASDWNSISSRVMPSVIWIGVLWGESLENDIGPRCAGSPSARLRVADVSVSKPASKTITPAGLAPARHARHKLQAAGRRNAKCIVTALCYIVTLDGFRSPVTDELATQR
jgi:hypothetical protein